MRRDGNVNTQARPRGPRSLQVQLVVLISGVVALVSLIIGMVTVTAVRKDLVDRVDRQLQVALHATLGLEGPSQLLEAPRPMPTQNVDEAGSPRIGSLMFLAVSDVVLRSEAMTDQGEVVQLSDEELAHLLEHANDWAPTTVNLGNLGTYRVQSRTFTQPTNALLIVGQSLADTQHTARILSLVFAGTAAVGVLLASGVSTLMVRRALRPLESLRQTASRVSETPLSSGSVTLPPREPIGEPDSEVGDLSESFNQMMDHVERALQRREASEAKLKRFASDASHELRTPLATISGYAEYAQRDNDALSPDVSQSLSRIRSETSRMAALVEDLLLLARLDAQGPTDTHATLIAPTVIESVADARTLAPDKDWVVEIGTDEAHLESSISEPALRRVLTNLLSNARVHATTATRVTTRLTRLPNGDALLEVEDDGPGVPADLAPHVFDRFVRGDEARTRFEDGGSGSTGLGLSITEELVRAAGGSLELESRPGRTVFSVTLPKVGPAGTEV